MMLPLSRLQARGRRVQFGLGAVLPHSNTPSLRVAGFEDEDDNEDEYEAPSGQTQMQASLKRVTDTPVNLHEVISGAVDEVIIDFAEGANVRCEPVFQTGASVSKHVIVSVPPALKPSTIGDEIPETA